MKIPKSVMVLTQRYKVVVSKTLLETIGAVGLCDSNSYTIHIDASLVEQAKDLKNDSALKRVFYHELVHAYLEESGVCQFAEDQSNEMIAQTLSAFIIQLLG